MEERRRQEAEKDMANQSNQKRHEKVSALFHDHYVKIYSMISYSFLWDTFCVPCQDLVLIIHTIF